MNDKFFDTQVAMKMCIDGLRILNFRIYFLAFCAADTFFSFVSRAFKYLSLK